MASVTDKKEDEIFHNGKFYTIKDLKNLRELRENEYYKPPIHKELDKYALKSLEITEEQLYSLKKSILTQKASSWKSRQRKLRKEGNLEQYKIDELNKLGMLWNPLGNLWEMNFSYFRRFGLSDPIEKWVKEQRRLFREKKLSDENYLRLNGANFPFEEKETEAYKLDIYQIIFMEEQLISGEKVYDDVYTKENFYSLKKKVKKNIARKLTRTQLGKIDELSQMSFDDFKFEIDKVFAAQYRMERISGVIKSKQQHYSDIYLESFKYLTGIFETGRVSNYLAETVKYTCPDIVSVYASEKALNHIDKFMLNTGKYNDYKKFPPVNKLILYYSKNKMRSDLIRINEVVLKHSVLKAIYSERINKLIFKINKL